MVIIGEPGGGKTAAAILLLLEIYKTPGTRVPVFFQLAAWRANRVPLNDWMIEQLATTYATPPKIARLLIEEDRILPILDGLDEVPVSGRRAAITALRRLAETPFVLTCRASEYAEVISDAVLAGAGVVEVAPVSITTAIRYLSSSGSADSSRWDTVIAALGAPGTNPCKVALSNPLMLSLARTVFQSASSRPAQMTAWRTVGEFQDKLLDGLLPAVYGRDSTDLSAERSRKWLGFFANNLSVLGPGAIGWWRLRLCVPQWRLRVFSGVLSGAIGVFAVLVAMSPAFIVDPALVEIYIGFRSGEFTELKDYTLVAVAGGCMLAGFLARSPRAEPLYWARPKLGDALSGALYGLLLGVFVAVLCIIASFLLDSARLEDWSGYLGVISSHLSYEVFAFLIQLGPALGFISGLIGSFFKRQMSDISPLQGFKGDLRGGLYFGLAGALIAGLIATAQYLILWRLDSAGGMLTVLAPYAVIAFAWLISQYSSVPTYLVAVGILALRRDIPRRPLSFLEDAYKRGVLRKTGMTFEFRHNRLAERLKSRHRMP